MSVGVDERTHLVLAGHGLRASDRGLLRAHAAYAQVITERREAAAARVERMRLAETDRMRTALLAAVSHDLRSPLAAVKAGISSLRSTEVEWSDEDEAELLATTEEATDRLIALVSNLLDMSRIHTGAVRPVEAEVGLARAVSLALASLPGAERIDVAVPEELLVVADPGLLERVVVNLCDNALKYTGDEDSIRVDGVCVDERVILRVADEGRGVAPEERAGLFAPFQRLGDVPQHDGVGLGLTVARGLTEVMHGTISAEETPGGGLTFVVDLPAAQEGR